MSAQTPGSCLPPRRWSGRRAALLIGPPIALFALFATLAIGAEVKPAEPDGALAAMWDRKSAPVGDVVTLTLDYRLPQGGRLPEPPAIGGLEELTIVGREVAPGQIRLRLLVDQIETLKTGPLSLIWLDKDQRRQMLRTDSISLPATSNLGDKPAEAQLRPLQGIVPTRPPWLRYLPWVLGVSGLILAAAGWYWWLRRRRRHVEIANSQEPPHLWAAREIERLETQKSFEKGRVKEFYFRLSEILRRYLEAIRGFPAAEYTVEEIARSVQNDTDRRLLVLLRQADLVKFADAAPTLARKEEEVKTALAYIRETAPHPETESVGGNSPGKSR